MPSQQLVDALGALYGLTEQQIADLQRLRFFELKGDHESR